MADTVIVDLSTAAWVQITDASGFMTNESYFRVVYREAASPPSNSLFTGHTLENSPGAFVQFALTSPQKIYARTVGRSGSVAFTPET